LRSSYSARPEPEPETEFFLAMGSNDGDAMSENGCGRAKEEERIASRRNVDAIILGAIVACFRNIRARR
jgi:hypothetical protein